MGHIIGLQLGDNGHFFLSRQIKSARPLRMGGNFFRPTGQVGQAGGLKVREHGLKHQKEKRSMDHFAGLDVSVKEISVCIVDDTGNIVCEVKVTSELDSYSKTREE